MGKLKKESISDGGRYYSNGITSIKDLDPANILVNKRP